MDVDTLKSAALDKVIGFISDTEMANPSLEFNADQLEEIYLNYLLDHSIFRKIHTTRFAQKLIENIIYYTETINLILLENASNTGEFINSSRKIISPIRQDIFNKSNAFSGTVTSESQTNSVSILLLALTSMLVDGHVDIQEGGCSQAALSIADCHF